jgi:integrase
LDIVRRNLKGRIGDVYLFAQKKNGRPYSYNYIMSVWHEHSGLKIPLKDATRRSWATNMRNAGVSMNAIQRGLGHKTIKTTELYLDSDVAWAREEFERADKVLRFKPAKPVLNEK